MIVVKDIFRSIKKFRQGPEKNLPIQNSQNESLEPLKQSCVNKLPCQETGFSTFKFTKFEYFGISLILSIMLSLLYLLTTYKILYNRENLILQGEMKYQGSRCGVVDNEGMNKIDKQMQYWNDYVDLNSDTSVTTEDSTLIQIPNEDNMSPSIQKTPFKSLFYDMLNKYDAHPQILSDEPNVDISNEYDSELPALDDSNLLNVDLLLNANEDADFENANKLLQSIRHNVNTFEKMLQNVSPEDSKTDYVKEEAEVDDVIREIQKEMKADRLYLKNKKVLSLMNDEKLYLDNYDFSIDDFLFPPKKDDGEKLRIGDQYSKLTKNDQNFVEESKSTVKSKQCINVPTVLRFDCHPEDGASQSSCEERGCCWMPADHTVAHRGAELKRVPLDVPYCYYPDDWPGYEFINGSRDGNDFTGFLKRKVDSFYKKDIPLIKMEATSLDKSILRVKIYDAVNPRYEPPWPIRSDKVPYVPTTKFTFETDDLIPGFRVNRAVDKTTLFDSVGISGFIFADQFLQISGLLPSHNIYGLGEHRTKLKLNTNWQSFTMFNQGQPPVEQANLYGSHPFYLVIEDSGNCHGVLFLNSNAMDVILQPTPAVTFRTIGGIFDIYFFMGPTPTDVMKQYSEIVGKPFLPPYWSLGFHLCRFGYGSLQRTKEVWNRTRDALIPFVTIILIRGYSRSSIKLSTENVFIPTAIEHDTQWNDIDYMDRRNDFTYDKEKYKELPAFVEELHDLGMHYIPIIDAGISASEINGSYAPYDEGVRQNIFIKDAITGLPFTGKVWNRESTVWPDFTDPKAQNYWLNMMENLHRNISYDGAWIDMNEPSNFYNGHSDGCPYNDFDNPQYLPNVIGNLMASQTLCMNAKHYLGPHYNLHNTYGTNQAIATNHALKSIRRKRPFIISRSTWVGHGFYAGHWSGDNLASWHDLQMSIPQILAFNMFQIPMVGADICGFRGNTTEELCNRWMQVGAFYPFSRNHNADDTIDQDPVAMGKLVVTSSRKALMIRYRFLPYLYTLFFRAHKFGETVARPLFFEFVNDPATYDIDTQFLWGNSFMVVPVLEESKTKVNAYLPRGLWYNFYSKSSVFSTGRNFSIPAPLDTIPLLIRAGIILPAQTPATTTTASRRKNFELLVALDSTGFAKGELYWDDGDSLDSVEKQQFRWLEFMVKNKTLRNHEIVHGLYDGDMILGKVSIMGVDRPVDRVWLNGNQIGFVYERNRSYLNVKHLIVDMKEDFVLSWQYK